MIEDNQNEQLNKYIKSLPEHIRIHKIINDEGYTLLHMAACWDMAAILSLLIQWAKKELKQE